MASIQLAGIIRESIVDGPGIRFVVFVQGCPHKCPGCHNAETHDPAGGYTGDTSRLFDEFIKNPMLKGMTFSGGEPFEQAHPLIELAKQVHETGKNIITFTGYTLEYLLAHANDENGYLDLLKQTDILIDGPFILEKKSMLLHFRGSSNQRALDVAASLEQGKAVEIEI